MSTTTFPAIDREKLLSEIAQMQRRGVPYGYGAKAEGGHDPRDGREWNKRSTGKISTPVDTIDNLDCSGAIRKWLFDVSGVAIPDGSQAQLAYFEKLSKDPNSGVKQIDTHGSDRENYKAAARYVGKRVFICFITPWVNGCDSIGHVFLLFDDDDPDIVAETGESHGGHGVDSRRWDTPVLIRQVHAVYELPVK